MRVDETFDLSPFTGTGRFGPAYRRMLENDCHAPGSVDRVLFSRMVRLSGETADFLYGHYTPTVSSSRPGSRARLESCVREATAGRHTTPDRMDGIAGFTSKLADRAAVQERDIDIVGGTEEEIIERGSDWCVDVARAACVLCQVAGIPARIVYLFDTKSAYRGHAVIEAWYKGKWGAADPLTNVVYRHGDSTSATTWDLMRDAALIEANAREGAIYSRAEQFRAAAIVNYFAWEADQYDYTTARLNDYYREILKHAEASWPGGRRWLFGEDKGG